MHKIPYTRILILNLYKWMRNSQYDLDRVTTDLCQSVPETCWIVKQSSIAKKRWPGAWSPLKLQMHSIVAELPRFFLEKIEESKNELKFWGWVGICPKSFFLSLRGDLFKRRQQVWMSDKQHGAPKGQILCLFDDLRAAWLWWEAACFLNAINARLQNALTRLIQVVVLLTRHNKCFKRSSKNPVAEH